MKNSIISFTLLFLLTVSLMAGEKQLILRVSNPLNADRPGELVTVKWSALAGKLPGLSGGSVAVFEKLNQNR